MASYFQMGHNCENLVGESELNFSGIILSPVNRNPSELQKHVKIFQKKKELSLIFDPQLYFPAKKMGKLKEHNYFPMDLATADLNSMEWWEKICDNIISFAKILDVEFITSPVILPKIFEPDYYFRCNEVNKLLKDKLDNDTIGLYTTVLVQHNQLTNIKNVLDITSCLSSIDTKGFYIVLESDIPPRNEFKDPEMLFGIMQLIKELKQCGKTILFSNCSSDMLLYKYAGADNCATGKYFNLRRFTKSRFSGAEPGGSQVPYFFCDGLLSFIREADYLRIKSKKLGNILYCNDTPNLWETTIEENFLQTSPDPWIAVSWKQYLSWFTKAENHLSEDPYILDQWLEKAENNWEVLNNSNIFMDEPNNNGEWIRSWKHALKTYKEYNGVEQLI